MQLLFLKLPPRSPASSRHPWLVGPRVGGLSGGWKKATIFRIPPRAFA
ncbi:hypothetical protein [Ottowia thiooxydans]|nr:hypothetical protein [Ottowia thiooxydans]